MKLIGLLLYLSVGCLNVVFAQFQPNDGYPKISNISPDEYAGHIQNWDFAEDSTGLIYVANLQSILQYDGVNWNEIPLPSKAYSIHGSKNGKIFVGTANDFGYLQPTVSKDKPHSIPEFVSLNYLLPKNFTVELVYNIVTLDSLVVFLSGKNLFVYNTDTLHIYESDTYFSYIFTRKNEIYVQEAQEMLKKLVDGNLQTVENSEIFKKETLFSYLKLADNELFCSYRSCFVYSGSTFNPNPTEVDVYLSQNYLDEAIVLENGSILIGTRKGGLLNIDADGKLIHKITKDHGLISNTIYGLFEDRNGSVWIATDNGISKLDYSLPLRFFGEEYGIKEGVNAISKKGDQFIFSSNTGVYFWKDNKDLPAKLSVSANCSNIYSIKNHSYIKCGSALFKKNIPEFDPDPVIKGVEELTVYNDSLLVYANSKGIFVEEFKEDKWQTIAEKELSINPNSILVDHSKNIWIGTDFKGVYKVKLHLNSEIKIETSKYFQDFVSDSKRKRIHITELRNEPAFLTWGKAIQRYDPISDTMFMDDRFGAFFTDTSRQYFWAQEDKDGNVWFRSGSEYQAALLRDDGTYQLYEGALKLVDHRQSNDIFPLNNFIWFATDQGLVRYNMKSDFDHSYKYSTRIVRVLVKNDSLLNVGLKQKYILDYNDNELRFTFAAASYFKPVETTYRVKLEGFDDEWSTWSNETQKDYTNIPEGTYTFEVQTKNIFGTLSTSEPFSFTVLPPWYRSWWAYILYTFTIAGILYIAYTIRVNQLLKVERIRNRIASDLHDEVSATLSSISYFAQAAISEKALSNPRHFIELIYNSSIDAKEKISDIVWAINPEHDNWPSFLSKCRRFASDLLESKRIKYSLKIAEDIPLKLNMQLRQHLWLIYKEMITNAARHSDAKNVDVILKYQEGALNLVVQDDGKGMDVDKVKMGNGLVNIQKRIDEIKGEIQLTTDHGFGTRWILKVPL